MDYTEVVKKVLDNGTDIVTAAYEDGKTYVMKQLQKFLEENEK